MSGARVECSKPGCARKVRSRGLCHKDYEMLCSRRVWGGGASRSSRVWRRAVSRI
jgi:hypothetical protein